MNHEYPPFDPVVLSQEDIGMLRELADTGMVMVRMIRQDIRVKEFNHKPLDGHGAVAAQSLERTARVIERAIVLKGVIAQDPANWARNLVAGRRAPAQMRTETPDETAARLLAQKPQVPRPVIAADLNPHLPRIPLDKVIEDFADWMRQPPPDADFQGMSEGRYAGQVIARLQLDLETTRRCAETLFEKSGIVAEFDEARYAGIDPAPKPLPDCLIDAVAAPRDDTPRIPPDG